MSHQFQILLAEDCAPIRRLVRMILEGQGYDLLEAENGRVALELFRAHADTVKLLVTDISMPEMTGWQLIAAVRMMDPALPVLMTSAQRVDTSELTTLGGDTRFLEKPFPIAVFTETVKEMWMSTIAPPPALSEQLHRRRRRRRMALMSPL